MSQQINTYDVAIVGAGVIGSALALHLAQSGYKVALLDLHQPALHATNPERVIALSEGSARYLNALGVWKEVIQSGAGIIQAIDAFEPGQSGRVEMSSQALEAAQALGYVLETRHVLAPIYQRLQQVSLQDNVDIFCPASCLAVKQHETGVSLRVKLGNDEATIQTKLLAGADGTNSFIRQTIGVQTFGWDHNRVGIVASVATEHGHSETAYECFKEEGPLALLPLADGRFSLVWSVAPQHAMSLLALDDVSFLKTLEQEVGLDVSNKTGAFTSLGAREMFPLELCIAKSFAKGRVMLLGNAAHTIHPIAGQGMNLGLRDVAVLADILSQDWAKKDVSQPLIAQTYAERRRLDTLAVAGFTEAVLETFSPSVPLLRWLRGQGLKMTQTTPFLKQTLLKQAAGMGQLKGLNL